ncbi:hypothetical protein ISN44_As02g008310 [Arabidopsis suecica]|uniref:Uncharacterized protein n=1 Tax=Arabidopsis suecica TaxID=45249 RepID=A0A8T2FXR4_ARASU|nr:hypothetical protein ISN44_As02g008310 [Arabidopsis suecica]
MVSEPIVSMCLDCGPPVNVKFHKLHASDVQS